MKLNSLVYLSYHFFGIEKHVKSLAILHCFDENFSVGVSRLLSSHSFSILLIPINGTNIEPATAAIQSFGSNSLGIYLDYNCNSSDEILTSVSM